MSVALATHPSPPSHLAYWQLQTEPFRPHLRWPEDRRLVYRSRSWEEATARIQYVAENQFGLAILAGRAGTGKTLLLQAVGEMLRQQNITAIKHSCQPAAFPEFPLGAAADWETRQLLSGATATTTGLLAEGAYALLLDHLEQATLSADQWRALLDRLLQQRALSCVVVAISSERASHLFEQLASYAPLMISLKLYSVWESAEYLQHHLLQAGGKPTLFTEEAVELLHEQSQGNPRWLNRLAHECLLMGALQQSSEITFSLAEQTIPAVMRPQFSLAAVSEKKAA